MKKNFKIFRSAIFLGWLCLALAATSIAAGVWAFQMTTTVAAIGARTASMATAHRRELAEAVAKVKAKARLRRVVVAIPVAGAAAMAYFEEQDYQDWLADNPQGSRRMYACTVAVLSGEVVDEVLQDLPDALRPDPETILGAMPDCGA
ncbi:hypothetical protein [Tritonibacter mobilis]|uniref:hypothetical protein n=1 Tax=Tritonibacter mobilis TaxID=379347 RepID=UPI000806F1B4|nr:hypothetical protein [Tritonibacter mobilis]GLP87077.1 hypothetical protein GCM10007921_26370 [Tritonibacter mobilis]